MTTLLPAPRVPEEIWAALKESEQDVQNASRIGDAMTQIPFGKMLNIETIMGQIEREVLRATELHKPMNSPHEAHSVIEEEFDEFWDEVKRFNLPKGRDSRPEMREELIQLAAMAVRAISDVIDKPVEMMLAPLPVGVEDNPENRARLQAYVEGQNARTNITVPTPNPQEAGKQPD